MVFLPCCKAAYGVYETGRGVIGLRSAFLQAGARTLVLPLWQVDDFATALFMERLCRALFLEKRRVDEGLIIAKEYLKTVTVGDLRHDWLTDTITQRLQEMRAESQKEDQKKVDALLTQLNGYSIKPDNYRPFVEPKYWAPFICVGNPSPIA